MNNDTMSATHPAGPNCLPFRQGRHRRRADLAAANLFVFQIKKRYRVLPSFTLDIIWTIVPCDRLVSNPTWCNPLVLKFAMSFV